MDMFKWEFNSNDAYWNGLKGQKSCSPRERYDALVAWYELQQLSGQRIQLQQAAASFPGDFSRLEAVQNELNYKEDQIARLQKERSSLGLFSGKRKKEIDIAVDGLRRDLEFLRKESDRLRAALRGYTSLEEIYSESNAIERTIGEKQEVINRAGLREVPASPDACVRELLSGENLSFVLEDSRVFNKLLQHPVALEIIMNDPNNASRIYDVKLPQALLDQLEGTREGRVPMDVRDERTEEQLVADFRGYFSNPLFAEYEIVENVAPGYFGAHPKCKPISFLFRKDGKDLLAVAVLKTTSYSHSAVKEVKTVCLRRGISYARFFVGFPNKEHYVVRRVLEELGEIDCFYTDFWWQRCSMEDLRKSLSERAHDPDALLERQVQIAFREKHKINL